MYLPNPSAARSSNFKRGRAGLNLEFFFWSGFLTKAKESSLSYDLPTVGGERIDSWLFQGHEQKKKPK